MSKPKVKAKIAKAREQVQKTENKVDLDKQLSPEQYEELSKSLENFQESTLSFLAGTAQFEIVPTTDEFGNFVPEKNLELIRRECKRLGLRVLYSVDLDKGVMLINPDTMKTVIIANTVEVH